jgi:nitrite reductase/ring-hydroxylating ferredoxin subunit
MLKASDNELLTRVGAATPMGELLRRYWVPALPSADLAGPLGAPRRLSVMGQQLVAFRGEDGLVGVLAERCAHRCASLYFGRNEVGGLRCIYHGWKYDRSGQCVEQPTEPSTSGFKDKIKIPAYPVAERAGIIWIYLGPPADQPDFPQLEWLVVPPENVFCSVRLQQTNFVQAIEGGIDSSHVSVLHQDARRWRGEAPTPDWDRLFDDSAPQLDLEPTDYGMAIGACRRSGADRYWRVTQWVMPWYTLVPRDGDRPINAHAWVPLDDTHTWTWSISYHPDRPLTRDEIEAYRSGAGIHAEEIPGSHVPVRNKGNDYLMDRLLQRVGFFSGIEGIPNQDAAVQESMGEIVDRSAEHLGTSDAAIVVFRRRLLRAATALRERGEPPPGLDPLTHRIRSASAVLGADASWVEATAALRRAGDHLYRTS